jgi:hypothetical protein
MPTFLSVGGFPTAGPVAEGSNIRTGALRQQRPVGRGRLSPSTSSSGSPQRCRPSRRSTYFTASCFTIIGFIAIGLGVALWLSVKTVLALMKGVR